MKKLGLICATLLAGLSLSACGNMASQPHKASSSSSSAKVVKHHHRKAHKRANKQSSSSSSVVSSASSSNESTGVAKANNVSNNQSVTSNVPSAKRNDNNDASASNSGSTFNPSNSNKYDSEAIYVGENGDTAYDYNGGSTNQGAATAQSLNQAGVYGYVGQ